METIQLLEKVMIDLLKDPQCPIYQYRDSQLKHICQQLNLYDFTNVRDDQFHQKFAKLFIRHLTSQNELATILESSKVKRRDQSQVNQEVIQKSQQKQSERQIHVENRARKTGTPKNTLTLKIVEEDIRKGCQFDSSYSVTPAPKTTNFNFKDNNFSFQQVEAKKHKSQTPKISQKKHHLEPIPKKKVDICEKTIKEIQQKQIQYLKEQKEREIREREYSRELEKNDKRNFFNSLRYNEENIEKKKSKAVVESSSSSEEIVIRLSDHEMDVKPKQKQVNYAKEHREISQQRIEEEFPKPQIQNQIVHQQNEEIITKTPDLQQILPPQQQQKKIINDIDQQQPVNIYLPTVNQFKQEISQFYSGQQMNNHLLPKMVYSVPPIIPTFEPQPFFNENIRSSQGVVRIQKNFTPNIAPKLGTDQKTVTETPKLEKQLKKAEKEVQKQIAVPQNQQNMCGPTCHMCSQIEIPSRLVEVFDDALICASCLLEKINPFNKIIFKLFQLEYKYQGKHFLKSSTDFTISQEQILNPSLLLELRCVMLNKNGLSDITFPNSCQLSINGVIFKEIRPLIDKSCLKKRKDNSIFINLQEFIKTYGMQRKYTFSCIEILPDQKMRQDIPLQVYFFGLYLVQHQTVNQVIETIRKSSKIQYVKDLCKNEIKIDKTKVTFICQMSLEIMQIPAKGEFCQHQQCFCLKNYLEMMHSAEHRKWTCPFCKKVCWSLIIDKNQLQILDRIRQLELNIDQITLEQDGSIDKDDPLNIIIKDETITKYQDVIAMGLSEIQKKVTSIEEDDDIFQEPRKEGENEFQAIVID